MWKMIRWFSDQYHLLSTIPVGRRLGVPVLERDEPAAIASRVAAGSCSPCAYQRLRRYRTSKSVLSSKRSMAAKTGAKSAGLRLDASRSQQSSSAVASHRTRAHTPYSGSPVASSGVQSRMIAGS